MITMRDVDASLSRACNMLDLTFLMNERPGEDIIEADENNLIFIRDFLQNEIIQLENTRYTVKSSEERVDRLKYIQLLIRPLTDLKALVEDALHANPDNNEKALRLLSEKTGEIRRGLSERMMQADMDVDSCIYMACNMIEHVVKQKEPPLCALDAEKDGLRKIMHFLEDGKAYFLGRPLVDESPEVLIEKIENLRLVTQPLRVLCDEVEFVMKSSGKERQHALLQLRDIAELLKPRISRRNLRAPHQFAAPINFYRSSMPCELPGVAPLKLNR